MVAAERNGLENMEKEYVGSTYENGKRIAIQRIIYNKSDDLFALAELQERYERILKNLSDPALIDPDEIADLTTSKKDLEAQLTAQQIIVDGYGTNTSVESVE